MITLLEKTVEVKCADKGYYLRWYFNGWHYWLFKVGDEILSTTGEWYNTQSATKAKIGDADINQSEIDAIRTIKYATKCDLLTDDGWKGCAIDPQTINIYRSASQKYSIELNITVYAKIGDYSPVVEVPIPTPPPPVLTGDLAVLAYIRDNNPSSLLSDIWSNYELASTWEGVFWDGGDPLDGGRVISLSLFAKEVTSLNRLGELTMLQNLNVGMQDATIASINLSGLTSLFECNILGATVNELKTEESSEYLTVTITDSTINNGVNLISPISVSIIRSVLDLSYIHLSGGGYLMLDNMQGSLLSYLYGVKSLTVIGGAVLGLDMQNVGWLENLTLQNVGFAYLPSVQISNLEFLTTVSATDCGFTNFYATNCPLLTTLIMTNSQVLGVISLSDSPLLETLNISNSSSIDGIVWPSSGDINRKYINVSYTAFGMLNIGTFTNAREIIANNSAISEIEIPNAPLLEQLMLNDNAITSLSSITSKIGTYGMVYDFRFNNMDITETSRLIALGYDSSKVLPQL